MRLKHVLTDEEHVKAGRHDVDHGIAVQLCNVVDCFQRRQDDFVSLDASITEWKRDATIVDCSPHATTKNVLAKRAGS